MIDPSQLEREAYDELQCYTLTHRGAGFIHQHVVDAWAAQHADADSKPIYLAFALLGIYLHVVRGFSGRKAQLAHMKLARKGGPWPRFVLPDRRGEVTAVQVRAAAPGAERDGAIDAWCRSVWEAFGDSHERVAEFASRNGLVRPGG